MKWEEVLHAVDAGAKTLKYLAPIGSQVMTLNIVRRYKNGKLRLQGYARHPFTADSSHADRITGVGP